MRQQRYRRPPLSDYAKAAYERVHYCHAKQEYADRLIDVYEYCQTARLPFVAIIQPRRYCTLEIDLDPCGLQLNLPAQMMIRLWAENALDLSDAPTKSKSIAVHPTGAVIRGLERDHAHQLAQNVWRYVAENRPDREGAGMT